MESKSGIATDILSSWKEIAAYLNHGVRTVQRWEAEYGMPVHRPAGRSRTAVVAFRSELDRWLKAEGAAAYANADKPGVKPRPNVGNTNHQIKIELVQSVERCHSLCAEMQQHLASFTSALAQCSATVRALLWQRSSENLLALRERIAEPFTKSFARTV